MRGIKEIIRVIIACTILLLAGCATSSITHPHDSILNKDGPLSILDYSLYTGSIRSSTYNKDINSSSLWVENNPNAYLFQDTKAGNIGDIVTVRIIENAKGSRDASTKTERDSSIATTLDAFFGLPTNNRSIKAGTKNSFDGSGKTSRSGQLSANITARVMDVLPNGNLVIEGRREVLVNSEKQVIVLSGIIRPADIGPKNVILSTYIADAKIEYTGKGVLNDKQRPGWAIRILDWIWPF